MQIKESGSYAKLDDGGFILNSVENSEIQDEYKNIVEHVKRVYTEVFGADIHNIYLRGSVAKGEAVPGISDIDAFAFTYNKASEEKLRDLKRKTAELAYHHPILNGADLTQAWLGAFYRLKPLHIMLKTQSKCIYGPNLAYAVQDLKPGHETNQHLSSVKKEVEETLAWLSEEHSESEIMARCTWIMKRLLRSIAEKACLNRGLYTRDLYRCYELAIKEDPLNSESWRRVLELAVNPSVSVPEVKPAIESVKGTFN